MITVSPFHFFIFFDHRDAARSWNPRVSCLSVVVLVEVKMVLGMAHLSCLVVLMQLGMLLYNSNNHYNLLRVVVVVGALGTISRWLAGHLEQLGILGRKTTMQKSVLLGSAAHILGKVMGVWGLGWRLDWTFIPKENSVFYGIIIILVIMLIVRIGSELGFFAELYKSVNSSTLSRKTSWRDIKNFV